MTKHEYDLLSADFFRTCNLTLDQKEAQSVYKKLMRALFFRFMKGNKK